MSTYAKLSDLPLEIDDYGLEVRALDLGPDFRRLTTVVSLRGGGHVGLGEDVTYEALDHETQVAAGPVLPLGGTFTLDGFSTHLGSLDLFHAGGPAIDVFRYYRRWAFESAALDLALRQAGTSLADALGMTPAPLRFVVSTRLDEGAERLRVLLRRRPELRFKLDPTDEWTPEMHEQLASLDVVDVMDLKGQYTMFADEDIPFGIPSDPATYRRVAETFPDALIEDPRVETPALREALRGHEDRVTWDAPIHSVDDVRNRMWPPRIVNVKPSRCGSVRALLDLYDFLREEGIGAYSGGQTELGPGRGQVQYLASLFHPDASNDIAPGVYNQPELPDGELPASPLAPAIAPTGFRWEG